MERLKLLMPAVLIAFLLFIPTACSQPQPFPIRPLCMSQFALVNHACSLLPSEPDPHPRPPAHPSLDDDGGHDHNHELRHSRHEHEHEHGHGHRHRHERHRHRHHGSPVQETCCRWLREVDDECVCDLLVRMPPFMARPAHDYTVIVGEGCSVTYECGGRLRV